MADFFKYVGKADRGIQDWSKIGKDISDDLKKVTDDRQAKRAKIDKLTSDAVNEVNNVQLGQNKTFNQFLLNGSGQTKEFLLMQEKLLKQGVLKPQDYLNSRQIVSDDWANLSEAAKSFNTDYAESMSRLQDGKAAMQELYQNEKYDAFMNVQDKDVFINPVDGRMYLTTTDGDGNIERDPASMLNVNSINARRKDKINKFNVQAEVQKATGALGKVVKALNANGVITRDDKRLNEYSMLIDGVEMTFADAKNNIIDSLMTSPRNNASILTDNVGGYTFTEVESEAGGKVIYLKENGMGLLEPQLTDEQLGVVRNNLDMEIEKQLGFKETSSYKDDLNARLRREEMALRKKLANKPKPGEVDVKNLSTMWRDLGTTSDPAKKKNLADSVIMAANQGKKKGDDMVLRMRFNDDNTITFINSNSSKNFNTSPISDDAVSWMNLGTEIFGALGDEDMKELLGGTTTINTNFEGIEAGREGFAEYTETPTQAYSRNVIEENPEVFSIEKLVVNGERQTTKNVNAMLSAIGLSSKYTADFEINLSGTDEVKVKDNEGTVVAKINLDDKDENAFNSFLNTIAELGAKEVDERGQNELLLETRSYRKKESKEKTPAKKEVKKGRAGSF